MSVNIEASAHAKVLSLPAGFADADYATIIFNDNEQGTAQIWPSERRVSAQFRRGVRFLQVSNLPKFYETYDITLAPTMYPSFDEIIAIVSWVNATSVTIRDPEDYIPFALSQNAYKMRPMKKLQTFDFNVAFKNKNLPVEPFYDNLPSLTEVKIVYHK